MDSIPIQEKIKIYRELKQMSQQELSYASGISLSTIKKYESGVLKPKIDAIQKIADAFGVSVYLFMDFNIETISDVFTLIYKMEEDIEMGYEIQNDEKGNPDYSTFRLSFTNEKLNHYLYNYMYAREMEQRIITQPDLFSTREEYVDFCNRAYLKTMEIVLTRCLDDTIISKNSDYSGFSRKHAASLKEIQKMKDDPEIQKELNKVYTFQPSTDNFEDTLLDPLPEHLKPDDDSAK